MADSLVFHRIEPKYWDGRYNRIMGDGGLFHIRNQNITVDWLKDGETGECKAIKNTAVIEIVKAVIDAKLRMGGNTGGGFIINEWCQIIVPASSGDGTRMLVGAISGKLFFENPFYDNITFDLGKDDNLKSGDIWPRPYIGTPYSISGTNRIYFERDDSEGTWKEYLETNDRTLERTLRSVRPEESGFRFIVNPFGIVLTKKRRGASCNIWVPRYVCRINYNTWFDKED